MLFCAQLTLPDARSGIIGACVYTTYILLRAVPVREIASLSYCGAVFMSSIGCVKSIVVFDTMVENGE